MRAAVVKTATNIVVNIIIADPSADPAPEGCILVSVDDAPCDIGWIYYPATNQFSPPAPEGSV